MTAMCKTICIIGSTGLRQKMMGYKADLEHSAKEDNENILVLIPAFDEIKEFDDLGVCEYNRRLIEEANEVHLLWDGRSIGTIFDFGMVFALRKVFKIIYISDKSLRGVMEKYALDCRLSDSN